MLHQLIGLLRFELIDELVQFVVVVHGGHDQKCTGAAPHYGRAARQDSVSGLAGGVDPAVQGGLGGAGVECFVGAGDAGGQAFGEAGELAGRDIAGVQGG